MPKMRPGVPRKGLIATGASRKRKLNPSDFAGGSQGVSKRMRMTQQGPMRGKRKAMGDGGPSSKRKSGVGFVTKSGKVVSFQPKGVRKAALAAKRASGEAKCRVNPATGRAVVEGSKTYKRLVKAGGGGGGGGGGGRRDETADIEAYLLQRHGAGKKSKAKPKAKRAVKQERRGSVSDLEAYLLARHGGR